MKTTRLLQADSLRHALSELLLIVAGILIALYLDGWWEDRKEREAERTALLEISRDLANDAAEAEIALQTYTGYSQFGRWWDENRGQELEAEVVEPELAKFVPIHLYQPQNASYVGLRSSGRLWLISDEALRSDLVRYFEHSQAQILQVADEMRETRRRLEDAIELDLHFAMGGEPNQAPPLELQRPWHEIPTDPRLPARIRSLATRAELIVASPDLYQAHLRLNADLRERIAIELGGKET